MKTRCCCRLLGYVLFANCNWIVIIRKCCFEIQLHEIVNCTCELVVGNCTCNDHTCSCDQIYYDCCEQQDQVELSNSEQAQCFCLLVGWLLFTMLTL